MGWLLWNFYRPFRSTYSQNAENKPSMAKPKTAKMIRARLSSIAVMMFFMFLRYQLRVKTSRIFLIYFYLPFDSK